MKVRDLCGLDRALEGGGTALLDDVGETDLDRHISALFGEIRDELGSNECCKGCADCPDDDDDDYDDYDDDE